MARLKLKMPEIEPVYTTEIPLLINFINYGGHMGNDAVLTLCHEARMRFLESINQSELSLFGSSLIQSDSLIIYKSEAHRGDQIRIKIYIDDLNPFGFDFFYLLENAQTNKEIARAKTGMVFFNYESKKPEKMPLNFKDLYAR